MTDYMADKAFYLELTAAQLSKLQQLSLVSLGAGQTKVLDYASLMKALYVDDMRSLENIVIDTIYADLIDAKMNQQQKQVHVRSVASRGVRVEDISQLVSHIQQWKHTATALSKQLARSNMTLRAEQEQAAAVQLQVQNAITDITDKSKADIGDDGESRY